MDWTTSAAAAGHKYIMCAYLHNFENKNVQLPVDCGSMMVKTAGDFRVWRGMAGMYGTAVSLVPHSIPKYWLFARLVSL